MAMFMATQFSNLDDKLLPTSEEDLTNYDLDLQEALTLYDHVFPETNFKIKEM